ncbi:hypothetical protein GCM10011588_65950 [Nocardia jinanensis]|uniref:Non-specific serine/threonine protein kinase n=1 Tax=Nocardia jinanensis TaxID=382504 RepID=A0A917RXB7_9NOCA|nr:hypothetical protein GCM10011588_65950 [Nocardia jinanensis]
MAELDAVGFEAATEIGRGGFGVVYRCVQESLDRTVAVKVLAVESDADNHARFIREQRAMGRLTGHPNIVTVLGEGVTRTGRPYLVTPYYPLGSLEGWLRLHGPLPAEEVLRFGVKLAGALECAHLAGMVHRDVKPGNILLTDYGEPALTDFGIAHIAGGFRTAAGTVTGSPAFTAPEVLEGEAPTPGADVYGLGATMFCALTGHAAFERRSGEKMVTQFLRITSQPLPDLREHGVAADVSEVVEAAMNRDFRERPSAADLGEAIREVQRRHGYAVADMALQNQPTPERHGEGPRALPPRSPIGGRSGNLPLELTGLVDRRSEVAEVKNLLSTSRLVTVAGTGGVGKTRLALRVATRVKRDFAGVWWIDLTDVSERSILVDAVAASVGVRDESVRPVLEVLVEFLCPRDVLLVLDNCEQLVAAVAELDEVLLKACPGLRILVTSREPLNIAGEAVVRLSPLTVPDPSREPTLLGLPRFDALTLFAERAAAAVPGFELDEDNKGAVAQICARLEGLPLAIELAAARLRAMSPQQILERLDDRFPVLTRGASRTAPARQQTLRLCIDWSYDLCTPAEQQLWTQLSVFAGSCELDAVEGVCDIDPAPRSLLDVLSSLVDKSILVREESGPVVRFRMLEMLRKYGRQELQKSGRYREIRRRHRDWYRRMVSDAAAGWISEQQPGWIARIEREQPNLRDALEGCLSEDTEEAAEAGLRIAAGLYEFWHFRGLYGEGRSWLSRVLACSGADAPRARIEALCAGSKLASVHSDFRQATALLEEARALAGPQPAAMVRAQFAYSEGLLALSRGDAESASSRFEYAVELTGSDPTNHLRINALTLLAWAHEVRGDAARASEYWRGILAVTEPRGELLHRGAALRGLGVTAWRQGERDRAEHYLAEALRVNGGLNNQLLTVFCLEALAWIVDIPAGAERAAVLMGAAQGLWPTGSRVMTVFHNLARFHEECERRARESSGDRRFDVAYERGQAMDMETAVAYALGEKATDRAARSGPVVKLTKRERQVAELVARGLSNKQIATKLVVSPRTAQGHVENILAKLGFTSRAQIAAWIVENAEH